MPRDFVKKPVRKKRKPNEILRLKRLILKLIRKFEKDLSHPEDFSGFWGEKESPVNVITKLSQILLKLFTITAAGSADKSFSRLVKEELSEEDFGLLADYFSRNRP
jgi:hypothetical protein